MSSETTATKNPGADSAQDWESRVQEFWSREGLPRRVLQGPPRGPWFRFTEGPPTANGRPHIGHLPARALKDAILRYRRMNGFRILSPMAGWDCHGLPVEIEVEKSHGWRSKKQILDYGLSRFAEDCRRTVRTYEEAWKEMSGRMGYWLDYDAAYHTMDASYIESVWWALQKLHAQGLLEKGHQVLPYCPRCETPEASHEVAQGYQETTDPSITVRLRFREFPGGGPLPWALVWTTTPWTLPSNLALAVHPELEYVVIETREGERYLLGEEAEGRYFPDLSGVRRVQSFRGKELVGLAYEPPFEGLVPPGPRSHRIYPGEFVSAKEGTGLVHVAPSFGADDYALGQREGLGVFDPLDASGRFTERVPFLQGQPFKAADRIIVEDLRRRGVLFREETYRHTYPFCWRCRHPLIYRALDSWFIRTHRLSGRLLAHNRAVRWIPGHLRDGRFGNFLSEAKDWALSRNRYWGTPLPIWNCPRGHVVVVGSFAELQRLSRRPLPPGFDPHRPGIDELPLYCPDHEGEPLVREPYVIDVWFDSGAAPFAQYHYPFESRPGFDPAESLDFVAEGLDQTRGWFYTLHVLATALFDRPPYRNVIANGIILNESGAKMSKSRGAVLDPLELFARYGADACRLTLYLSPYTDDFAFGENLIRLQGARMLATLRNVLEFYRANASLDRVAGPPPQAPHPREPLDRWLLSRLERLSGIVTSSLDGYDPHAAAQELRAFLEELSTWYLRRSRPRFWSEGTSEDKREAYETLSCVLATYARLLAPLAPFHAEYVYQTVTGGEFRHAERSVHLEAWPLVRGHRDPDLESAMSRLLQVVEGVRELRMKAGVKQRIPLGELLVCGLSPDDRRALGEAFPRLLLEEANVKSVTSLTPEEFSVRTFPEEDWVVGSREPGIALALSRRPDRSLWLEGLAREVIRRVQVARKEERLDYADRIRLWIWARGDLREALEIHRNTVAQECQADEILLTEGPGPGPSGEGVHHWEDVGGEPLSLRLARP